MGKAPGDKAARRFSFLQRGPCRLTQNAFDQLTLSVPVRSCW